MGHYLEVQHLECSQSGTSRLKKTHFLKMSFSVSPFPLFLPPVDIPWCSPIKVKYGDVYCRAPQGGYYQTTLGTRCDIRCQKGYELQGSPQVICQSNKRWSDKVICKRE